MNLYKTLKELLPLVSLKYADNTRHINGEAFKKSDSYKLLEGIKDDLFTSEEEAIAYICGDKKNPKGSYWALAHKTLSIFIGNLFLKPTEYKKDYKSVYQECFKKLTAVLLLRSEDRQESARSIAINTLKKSSKYHITEVSMNLCRELMLRYQIMGEAVESDKYKNLFAYYTKIYQAELSAYIALNEVALIAAKNKKPQEKELNEIISLLDGVINHEIFYKDEIKEPPYNLTMRRLRARVIKANFLNEHEEIHAVYSDLMHYNRSLNFSPPLGHIYSIKHKVSPSLILLEKYDEAKENIEDCISMRVKGEHPWHISLQHKAILGFYSKDYSIAKESIVLAKKNLDNIPQYMREWWMIAEAYLYFIGLLGSVEFDHKFKLAKFLNELPVYTQDKTGANVSIQVIAEFLIKLAQGDRDPLIEKNEAIRLYTYNNLEEESTKRSKIFFQILRKISRCAFDADQFEKGTKAQLVQLKSFPIKIEDLETEIVPYEELYVMVVEVLRSQGQSTKVKSGNRLLSEVK